MKKRWIAITKRVYYFFYTFFHISNLFMEWDGRYHLWYQHILNIYLTSFFGFFLFGGGQYIYSKKQQQNTRGYQLVITIVLFIALTAANHVQNLMYVRDPLPVLELCRIRYRGLRLLQLDAIFLKINRVVTYLDFVWLLTCKWVYIHIALCMWNTVYVYIYAPDAF